MPTAAFSKMALNRASLLGGVSISSKRCLNGGSASAPRVFERFFPGFPFINHFSPKNSDSPAIGDGLAILVAETTDYANARPRAGHLPSAVHVISRRLFVQTGDAE